MAIISRYPKGSDITVMDLSYTYPRRDEDTGKYKKDFMTIVAKDNNTGKKFHEIIYEPTYRFYMAKEGVDTSYNKFFIEKDKLDQYECKFTELAKTIAELTDNTDFYYDNIKNGNRSANKQLHWIPSVFGSDTNIEDHYRARFAQDYLNDIKPITKAYFDIEVDTIDMAGDFPQPGECPVNAISYIDDKTNSVNVFLLRNKDNPQIAEFENLFKLPLSREALFKELQQFIIDNAGGIDKATKFKINNFKFNFNFYDEEIQLIQDFFMAVNHNQPDFLLAWNMAFDIPYLIERIKKLGYDPAIIMSHPDFEEKYAEYFIDEKHRSEYELRGDYYKVASYTVYMDQLVQFASRRKGQAAFPNFKLDTAADIITKGAVRKLNYSHITTNLTYLPYKSYKTFVFYNIMDTIAQKCIEETVNDVDYIFSSAISNDTRYAKCHRQTVYLGNRTRKFYYDQGFILGNNTNTGDAVPYAGAMVGDPTHNSDYAKIKQYGESLNIMNNLDDFDFKSLYPSITRWHNMAPNTQKGKIIIDEKIHDLENPYHSEDYDRGGQFLEDLCTGNILEFGARWLGLARFRDLISDIDEYMSMNIPSIPVNIFNDDMIVPMIFYSQNCESGLKPIAHYDEGELIKPFVFNHYEDRNKSISIYKDSEIINNRGI